MALCLQQRGPERPQTPTCHSSVPDTSPRQPSPPTLFPLTPNWLILIHETESTN